MTEDKATVYHRLKRRAELAGTAAAGIVLAGLLLTGAAVRVREWASALGAVAPSGLTGVATVAITSAVLFLLLVVVELPFAFFQGFVLEHRYELSRQSLAHWLSDHGKGAFVGLLLALAGALVAYHTLHFWPDRWWLVSAIACVSAVVVLARLAPVVLLPIFYEFRPLDRPALAGRLLALARRASTDVVGVFEWVLSGHTRRANAALAGLGATRRILLSDTLLADYSDEEIEVVLAHELAHHVHHDLWRGIAWQAVAILGAFYTADAALRAWAGPLGLEGLDDPAGLPVLLLAAGAFSASVVPIANALSRAQERAADRYALAITGNAGAFHSAMRRLAQQNMAEEQPSRLVRWFFHSHPPIRERLEAARTFAATLGLAALAAMTAGAQGRPAKTLVAHRGASAYAPEHTLAAYRLAVEQGADFVEQDLAVTRDGVLICLHDASLERTTNVEEVFPNRYTEMTVEGRTRRVWLANDFTLDEVKRLDAGAWFGGKYAGERVPTFDEAVAAIRGKAGLFPELKTPEIYQGRHVRFEAIVAAALDRHRLRGPGADPATPVVLQTFSETSARTLAEMRIGVPVVLLVGQPEGWNSPAALEKWRGIVQGFGPAKSILLGNPAFVSWAHAAGFTVTPYTFRSSDPGAFPTVGDEMAHYLYTLGVDGVFTDNPDLFPREGRGGRK